MLRKIKIFDCALVRLNSFLQNRYSDSESKQICLNFESHLAVVLSTGILMWTYAFIALFAFKNPIPAYVGFGASVIHLLSPLTFLVTKNTFITSLFVLIPGIVHQSTFAYYSGGAKSDILLWFSVLPLVAGILSNIATVIFWFITCSVISFLFLYAQGTGYIFPMEISTEGYYLSRNILMFGNIFLSTILISAYLKFDSLIKKNLESKNLKVHNLLRILLHDISTPISIIKNSSKNLVNSKRDQKEQKSFDKIMNSMNIIETILSSVRQMYAVDIGKTQLTLKKYCISDIKKFLEFMFDQRLKDKDLMFKFSFNNLENENIFVDKVIFQNQILANIVSNSIKFSHHKSSIDIEVYKSQNAQNMVHIKISDHGIGMNAELISKIFDPKLSTSRLGTSGEKGTGLGMVIVKSLIGKMDGEIEVQSIEGTGTTFILSLPAYVGSESFSESEVA